MSEAAVLSATAEGISTITLNRPKALNALDRSLTLGLREAVFAAEPDFAEGIRAFLEKRKPQWRR